MSNIVISDLQPVELEYAELSDLELEAIAGGKGVVPGDTYPNPCVGMFMGNMAFLP